MKNFPKFTQKNLDKYLKKLSEFVFDIDDESRIILGILAKNGQATENKISNLGKNRILLSRDIVRRRLLIKDLSKGFVSTKRGKKINLKNKRERIFSLTFKGILASLYETKLSDNYWIKNYISNIEQITNKKIADLFLRHIYRGIVIHLILNANVKGSLTHYEASQHDIEDMYYSRGTLHHMVYSQTDVQGIPTKYKELFTSSAVEFYVLSTTISNLIHDLKIPKKYHEEIEYYGGFSDSRFMILFFEDWMYSIFDIIGKSCDQLYQEYPDHDDKDEEPINFEKSLGNSPTIVIEELSKKLCLKNQLKGKFDRAYTLVTPKPTSSERFIENGYDD